jgi:1,2-beta-oligoglucan phosphorylase
MRMVDRARLPVCHREQPDLREVCLSDISALDTIPAAKAEARQVDLADESALQAHCLGAAGGLTVAALSNGCIQSIRRKKILINQVLASPVAGGIHRIYLRVREAGEISFAPIVGPGATSDFVASSDQFSWTGAWKGSQYRCVCRIADGRDTWFFRVEIENRTEKAVHCDAVMVQDIGLAVREQIRNNETFSSQYLDYFPVQHAELGYLLMIRQNLPQPGGAHPWLLQGCFPKAVGFTTDGFDFFGAGYKADGVAAALGRENIGQRVRQYETGYTAIQSAEAEVGPSQRAAFAFFCEFAADHPEPSAPGDFDEKKLQDLQAICETMAWAPADFGRAVAHAKTPARSVFETSELFQAEDFDETDIRARFRGRLRHEEFDGRRRLSFFCGAGSRHVALKAKEIVIARPHGHIMRAGRGVLPDAPVLSCSFYAAGVFASQMTVGNTVFGKFLSAVRDPLNIVRSGGLRIFVRQQAGDGWRLLAVPSAFEMSPAFCRWHYKGDGNLLTVTCAASEDDAALTYSIRGEKQPVELLICGEIAAGPHEYETSPRLSVDARRCRIAIRPDVRSLLAAKYPAIVLCLVSPTPQAIEAVGGDELIVPGRSGPPLPYFAIQTRVSERFDFSVVGSLDSQGTDGLCEKYESAPAPAPLETAASGAAWAETNGAIRISHDSCEKTGQIQEALTWFARDAIIHFSVPRGLEQTNGGAWGVRDVCQGPVEFLLSYDRADIVKTILAELFSQQYRQRGDWPQWFMFPPMQQVQSSSCHGDIAIWPLKALCDYLEHCDDGEILRDRLPYTDQETFGRTEERETILEHVDRLIERIRGQFLPGWSIPRYGEGDWDDSLQPIASGLGDRMASSWTVALMYQTLRRYGTAVARFGEDQRAGAVMAMADQIQVDFQRCMMFQGVVAGFVIFDGQPLRPTQYLLHPADRLTGIRYRLIATTRGILSNIFSAEQAEAHLELIKRHLVFPDGARLMDRPTTYAGGSETVFRRSESAAFFGREIGLQYVHAHLRYAETLATMGHARELLHALQVANPISVTEVVKNAELRQRNCYFSSSDADFRDRYEAQRDYEKLHRGEVAVRAGWRIYSSGPGIYTGLVVRSLFGLRRYFDRLEFDPVLPPEFDGVECGMPYGGWRIRCRFGVAGPAGSVRRISINGVEVASLDRANNPYRPGGVRIGKAEFDRMLSPEQENLVQIEMGTIR